VQYVEWSAMWCGVVWCGVWRSLMWVCEVVRDFIVNDASPYNREDSRCSLLHRHMSPNYSTCVCITCNAPAKRAIQNVIRSPFVRTPTLLNAGLKAKSAQGNLTKFSDPVQFTAADAAYMATLYPNTYLHGSFPALVSHLSVAPRSPSPAIGTNGRPVNIIHCPSIHTNFGIRL
jgi:hypothetical protein